MSQRIFPPLGSLWLVSRGPRAAGYVDYPLREGDRATVVAHRLPSVGVMCGDRLVWVHAASLSVLGERLDGGT